MTISLTIVQSLSFIPCYVIHSNGDPDSEIRRWVNSLRVSQWNFGRCGEDFLIVISKDDAKVGWVREVVWEVKL